MIRKLVIASALTFGFGAATAIAQTTPAQPETGAAGPSTQETLPMGWDGAIGDAFFTDAAAGTLRSEAEIRTNWDGLTDAQQAQVRADCANVDTAASGTDDNMTTGSITPDGEGAVMASVQHVCGMVGAM